MTASSWRRVNLLAACDSPDLFGVKLFPAQRELLAEFEECGNAVWALGRQGGKSLMASIVCLHNALFRPDLDALMRRRRIRWAMAVATNLDQAMNLIDSARAIVSESPLLKALVVKDTSDTLTFDLGDGYRSGIRAWPCSSRGVRGFTSSCIVMDEAAHFVDSQDGYQAAEKVYAALRPTTIIFKERAQVLVISSPNGMTGFFADRFQRARDSAGWDARQLATSQVRPDLDAAYLEELRAEMPETFDAEYMAMFESGGDVFFDLSRFEPLAGELPATPGEGEAWIAGLDPAFSSDAFGVALVGRREGGFVLGPVEAIAPERPKGRRWSFEEKRAAEDRMIARVAKRCSTYAAAAWLDQHQSAAIEQRLREAGVSARTVGMTADVKYAAFRELRDRLYDGTLRVPNDERLLQELAAVRFKHGSPPKIVLPRSSRGHCDAVQALAVAVYKLRHIPLRTTPRRELRRPRPITAGVLGMRP